jgi:hypothetical protein
MKDRSSMSVQAVSVYVPNLKYHDNLSWYEFSVIHNKWSKTSPRFCKSHSGQAISLLLSVSRTTLGINMSIRRPINSSYYYTFLKILFQFLINNQHSTIKPTNALYFLSRFINPTYVSAAIEPSSGVQGHVHFNIHCSICYHHIYTTMYVMFLLAVTNTHCFRLHNLTVSFKCLGLGCFHLWVKSVKDDDTMSLKLLKIIKNCWQFVCIQVVFSELCFCC